MAPVIVCVVLTGMPKWEAMNSVMAPLVSAQKPPNGVSFVRRWPMVFTIRQPPVTVPNPIAAPHATTTQAGMLLRSVRCSGEDAKAPVAKACCSATRDRKSTRLNSSHSQISYAVFCLKKKKKTTRLLDCLFQQPPLALLVHVCNSAITSEDLMAKLIMISVLMAYTDQSSASPPHFHVH